ncbi:APC family permease [Gephyromycinifex aptenodytis]|nr:APC family permease [Gephyromycinifex aptenodytis]
MNRSAAPGPSSAHPEGTLQRRLGTRDAVVIGLGSMIGAGIFVALAPAAAAAGKYLLLSLCIAAFVAYCNATSSARLAAVHPESGGTYLYGTRQLGPFWGYLAGWAFIVGKTASCAAMALTVGAYAWPGHTRAVAVAVVVALTALNCAGIHKSVALTRVVVVIVLLALALFVGNGIATGLSASSPALPVNALPVAPLGVLQAAGLLFFAFAGYARIATLGEEVRDPQRTIPVAIPIALGLTLVVYAAVAGTLLLVLGSGGTAASAAPLLAAARLGPAWMPTVIQVAALVAATGSLLGLVLGVSRTTLAMARDGHLPALLARVDQRRGTPLAAEITVGCVVVALVLLTDLRGAIGFSSFGVLLYYAVANAAARTLPRATAPPRWVPIGGLLGTIALAACLPVASVLSGGAVIALGALIYALRGGSAPTMRRANSQ